MSLAVRSSLLAVAALVAVAACSGDPNKGGGPGQKQGTDGGDGSGGDVGDGGTGSGGTDGGWTPTSSTYPAFAPDVPQVVDAGGARLANPKLVPVFFANENGPWATQVVDFDTRLGGTDYWRQVTSEYGVGAASLGEVVHATESITGTITDRQIESWILKNLGGELPDPDEDTLLVLHYPAGTDVVLNDASGTEHSCNDFGGYHASVTMADGRNVAYAVVPHCPAMEGLSELDVQTTSESHEIIEAVTDPYPDADPAWAWADDPHYFWDSANSGSEVADMCQDDPAPYLQLDEIPYSVQRSWSNKSAKAGHDPCVPLFENEVYFNAVPDEPDNISFVQYGERTTIKGVKIPMGSQKTIQLHLFSDGDTGGPWQVAVQDQNQFLDGSDSDLEFILDKSEGGNGDVLNLTIRPLRQSTGNSDMFFVTCTKGDDQHTWIGYVGE